MKKVLFVATVVRLHINMFHKPYIRWFHEQGWQVDVAANNDYEDKSQCVIPCCDHFYCMPFERSPLRRGNLEAYRQLKKLLDQEHYDLIHCHTPMGSVITRLAAGSARNRGTKVIYTAHGFHFYDGAPLLNWLVYYPVERILARRTDMLITMNQEDYDRARRFKCPRVEKISGIGADLDKFTPVQADREPIRQQLGLGEEDTFAICVAQLIPRKNHITLLHAVAQLSDPHFHLFICGDGQQEQPLQQSARQLGIENQVHFLGFRRDVYRLCGAADLFLLSSLQEGLPVAVMEAMACGLPVVASDIRGNRDLIEPGKGGYLVPPSDAAGFAEAIRLALKNRDALEQMRAYNLEKVRACGIDAIVERMAGLYRSLLEPEASIKNN